MSNGRKGIADILESFGGLGRNDADHLAGMIVAAGYAKVSEVLEEQAKADADARINAQVTGSRGATVIRSWPGGEVTGRYSRCVVWDLEKNTICGIETTHTPCPFHPNQEG